MNACTLAHLDTNATISGYKTKSIVMSSITSTSMTFTTNPVSLLLTTKKMIPFMIVEAVRTTYHTFCFLFLNDSIKIHNGCTTLIISTVNSTEDASTFSKQATEVNTKMT